MAKKNNLWLVGISGSLNEGMICSFKNRAMSFSPLFYLIFKVEQQ